MARPLWTISSPHYYCLYVSVGPCAARRIGYTPHTATSFGCLIYIGYEELGRAKCACAVPVACGGTRLDPSIRIDLVSSFGRAGELSCPRT